MKRLAKLFFVLLFTAVVFPQSLNGTAPNFKLENINGGYYELKSNLGNGPVIISFWATWCKPCAEELGEYKELFKDYSEKGLTIIAISTDTEKSVAKVKPLVKSKGYPFVVLLDTNSDVARKYYASAVPYTVILDKEGNVVFTHLGYMKGDEIVIKQKIDELISK